MKQPTQPHRLWLAVCSVPLVLAWWPWDAHAMAQLQCNFAVNGETYTQAFGVVDNPYTVAGVPIGTRFRFKAVVLGDAQGVESINLYVYYTTRRQPMLMQHTQFIRPTAIPTPAPAALTGRVAVYSPRLGKELQYQCALAEVEP